MGEFDSKVTGMDWRSKIETQRGAVIATELKNNANKLAKWTCCALLAGADIMKLGFVSRAHPKDPANHVILNTLVQAQGLCAADQPDGGEHVGRLRDGGELRREAARRQVPPGQGPEQAHAAHVRGAGGCVRRRVFQGAAGVIDRREMRFK